MATPTACAAEAADLATQLRAVLDKIAPQPQVVAEKSKQVRSYTNDTKVIQIINASYVGKMRSKNLSIAEKEQIDKNRKDALELFESEGKVLLANGTVYKTASEAVAGSDERKLKNKK
jgi:hypothetical protein